MGGPGSGPGAGRVRRNDDRFDRIRAAVLDLGARGEYPGYDRIRAASGVNDNEQIRRVLDWMAEQEGWVRPPRPGPIHRGTRPVGVPPPEPPGHHDRIAAHRARVAADLAAIQARGNAARAGRADRE